MLLFFGVAMLAVTAYFARETFRANHYYTQLINSGGYESREALWFKLQGLRCLTSIFMAVGLWCMAWALMPTTMQESWDFAMRIIAYVRR